MNPSSRIAGAAAGRPALWPGLAFALIGSIAFSGKAIIVKLAYRHGTDAVTLLMLLDCILAQLEARNRAGRGLALMRHAGRQPR